MEDKGDREKEGAETVEAAREGAVNGAIDETREAVGEGAAQGGATNGTGVERAALGARVRPFGRVGRLSIKRASGLIGAGLILIGAGYVYWGQHFLSSYEDIRAKAKSIEGAFPDMESKLQEAETYWTQASAAGELGRVYLERAIGENQFGSTDKRDEFLDEARDALARQIRINPADSGAFYRLGYVYMLYNYPLLTYAEKGRKFMERALELAPSDEFLNVNALYLFLAQWDRLDEGERAFVRRRLEQLKDFNPGFLPMLLERWVQDFGTADRLKEILSPFF